MTGTQNTVFCQKDRLQSERTRNKFQYSVRSGTKRHRVCGVSGVIDYVIALRPTIIISYMKILMWRVVPLKGHDSPLPKLSRFIIKLHSVITCYGAGKLSWLSD